MKSGFSRRGLAALGASIAIAVAAAAASFAQESEPRGLPATPPAGESQDQAQGGQNLRPFVPRDRGQFARRGNRLERRLDFLHEALRISANQEQLWDSFAAAVRNEAQTVRDRFEDRRDRFRGPPDGRRGDGRRGLPSVVERLEQRQQNLAERGARVERLLAGLRPLYAALDDNQKRAADRLLFRPEQDRSDFRGPPFRRGGPFNRPFLRDYDY